MAAAAGLVPCTCFIYSIMNSLRTMQSIASTQMKNEKKKSQTFHKIQIKGFNSQLTPDINSPG